MVISSALNYLVTHEILIELWEMTGGAFVSNYYNYAYRDALSLERSRSMWYIVHP